MKAPPRKILITGAPASGKTTLAKNLSQKLSYPLINLDSLYYTTAHSNGSSLVMEDERIAKQEEWVAQGLSIAWTNNLLTKSELIIWLDISFPILFYRATKRYFTQLFQGRRKGISSLIKIFVLIYSYHHPSNDSQTPNRKQLETLLKPFHDKLVRIHKGKEVREYLSAIKP